MLLLVAVGILLAFLFVVLPSFIGFVNNFFNSADPFQQTDAIPPQIPIVSAPVSATNSATLVISGFGEPVSQLVAVHNGAKQEALTIAEDGSFKQEIELQDGENTLSFYSIDEAKNESALTKDYSVLFDAAPPVVAILEPADGSSFESRAQQTITLKGEVQEEWGAKVYINSRVIFPKEDGLFSYAIRLEEGENTIEVRAEDKAGNTSTTTVKYNFKL